MFDPLTVLAVGGVAAVAWVAGRAGRVRCPKDPVLVCSCGHGSGSHVSPEGCGAAVQRDAKWDGSGVAVGYEWVHCSCRAYDGPEPLPRVWTGMP